MSQRHRLWRKRFAVWPPLQMPEEGIFTDNGYLFHHETPQKLDENHKRRLMEYGIQLAFGERFTPEEDERIRKNWRAIARKYGFIYEDARYYAGYLENLEAVNQQRLQNDMLIKIGMWPQLCRKLECRSAHQIQRRIFYIFDPYFIGGPSPLSQEMVLCVHERALRGESRSQIAQSLGISRSRVDTVFSSDNRRLERLGWTAEDIARDPSLLDRNCLPKDRYRKLFETVVSKSSLCESQVAEYLRFSSSSLESSLAHFSWTELVGSFRPLQAKEIKHEWRNILSQLRESYLAHLKSLDEHQAWICATNEIMPERQFSLSDLIYYTKALRKSIDKTAVAVRSQFIDKEKLAKKLSARGIADVENFNLNTCPIYKRILQFLRIRNSQVFRHLRLTLTARETLRILEACYRRLKPLGIGVAPRTSLPKISMHLLVECVIDRMQHIDPSWQPPVILQPWVRSWDHVRFFSKCSNNEEVRNAVVDRHRTREMLFEDPKHCLYGSEPSNRELYNAWDDNWIGPSVSQQESGSPFHDTLDEQDIEDRNERNRSVNFMSEVTSEEGLHNHDARSASEASSEVEEHTWETSFRSQDLAADDVSEELFASDPNQGSSFDIFTDAAEDAALPGSVPSQGENANVFGGSPLKPTGSQPQTSHVPVHVSSSPQPSPKRRDVYWEDEEDSFDALKISVPAQPSTSKPQLSHGDEDSILHEGWLQFLS